MPHLVNLVVHDPSKVNEVIDAWLDAGVTGMTLLDSSGWKRATQTHEMRDDVPLMPSVRALLRGEEERSRMLFSVVDDEFDLDALIRATEGVLGRLDADENGILFVVPVTRTAGLRPEAEPRGE